MTHLSPSPQAGAAVKAADRAHVFHSLVRSGAHRPASPWPARGGVVLLGLRRQALPGLHQWARLHEHRLPAPEVAVAAIQEQAATMTTFAPAFAIEARRHRKPPG
ncbi:hypothetical protein ACRAWF_30850 [Streptomyces sp. L7]